MESISNLRIRRRIPKSCRRCHRRKQRCVGAPTCTNCEAANQPCIRSETSPSWHHGMSKGALAHRIEVLEARLSSAVGGSLSEIGVVGEQQSPQQTDNHQSEDTIPLVEGNESNPNNTYLGPSSGLSIAEKLRLIVPNAIWTKSSIPVHSDQPGEPLSVAQTEPSRVAPPDDAVGLHILNAYFENMHMRLPFLNRVEIYDLHARRHDLLSTGTSPVEQFRMFKLFMVYAIGASILQMTETYDSIPPSTYRATALQLGSKMGESLSIAGIEARMLSVHFSLRSSPNSSVWYEIGLAMRICIDLGLHREAYYRNLKPFEAQLRRRLFWCVYVIERYVSSSLGRPFSIAEEEIDVDVPADIDDSMTSDEVLENLLHHPTNESEIQKPNLRRFISIVRLQRIMSQIKTRIYRVDRHVPTLVPEIAPLMASLEEYKRNLPPLEQAEDDFVQMHWNSSVRMLLQPFLALLDPKDPLIKTCLAASGQMCQCFKRLRQRDASGYSFLLVNSVFMAGLTMCYCLFQSPFLWSISAANDLRACSSALFVMAERDPKLKKYRDGLETLINRAMDHVNDALTTGPSHIQLSPAEPEQRVHSSNFASPNTQPSVEGLGETQPPAMRATFQNLIGLPDTEISNGGFDIADPFDGIFTEDFWNSDAGGLPMLDGLGWDGLGWS